MNKAGQLLGLPADLLGKNLLSVHLEWTSNPKTNFSLADHVSPFHPAQLGTCEPGIVVRGITN